MAAYIQVVLHHRRDIRSQFTRMVLRTATTAAAPNHTAASKKNTAGPVVGTRAPHGQAITAIATAIAKCNPWLTINHGRRLAGDARSHSAAVSMNRPVTTQRSIAGHGCVVRLSRPKRRNRSELVTTPPTGGEPPSPRPPRQGSAPSAASGIAAAL